MGTPTPRWVLFIRNKDAGKVTEAAQDAIPQHDGYVRDAPPIDDVPVLVLHKDGGPDHEIKLALITAVIHP